MIAFTMRKRYDRSMHIMLIAFALVAMGVFLVFYKGFDMDFGAAVLSSMLGTGLLALLTVGTAYLGVIF